MPFSIHGWYKYPAITWVTCPIEVSVSVMCSLPSVCAYGCPFPLRCVSAVGVSRSVLCPSFDTTRCHHVTSTAILLRHLDKRWRVLSASDRWRLVAALPDGVSGQVWECGGRVLMARVGCRGTGDASTEDFPRLGTGFGGMDPRSG